MNRLVWFRKDLRVADNPALWQARQDLANSGAKARLYAVFFDTEVQWRQHGMGERQMNLLRCAVSELAQQLRALNIALIVIRCDTFEHSLGRLNSLCDALNVSDIYANHEYEINEQQRDQTLANSCQQQDDCQPRAFHRFHDQCLIPPGKVLTGDEQMYKVYSPFKRAWQKVFPGYCQPPKAAPAACDGHNFQPPEQLCADHRLPECQPDALWSSSEEEIHQQLQSFLQQSVQRYHELRDIPSQPATSQLSCALALGLISARQCLYSAWQQNACELAGGEPGLDSWINELIWREFYRHLIVAYPHLCRHKAFKPDTENVPWRYSESDFNAWCEGKTGYPIVDAAMRQLQQTGWMHNRLRMISAMFLTKHLLIDWRWGEAWFASQLVDFDLASNNGGWQWSASTGADGAPYFRIFNPTSQSQKFDPDGQFIVRFVQELAPLPAKQRHQPDSLKRRQLGYPQEIVEHKFGRERALAAFKGEPFVQVMSNNGKGSTDDLFSNNGDAAAASHNTDKEGV